MPKHKPVSMKAWAVAWEDAKNIFSGLPVDLVASRAVARRMLKAQTVFDLKGRVIRVSVKEIRK